jgi:hypothetical protein
MAKIVAAGALPRLIALQAETRCRSAAAMFRPR